MFVSSHQLAKISQLADEVVVVNRGRLVTQTSVAELTSERSVNLRTPQIDVVTDALRAAGATVLPLDDERVDISGLAIEDVGMVAAREGVVIYELSPAAHSLEEVFLNLTTMEGATR